jgi:hypothetical protein
MQNKWAPELARDEPLLCSPKPQGALHRDLEEV